MQALAARLDRATLAREAVQLVTQPASLLLQRLELGLRLGTRFGQNLAARLLGFRQTVMQVGVERLSPMARGFGLRFGG